jgi:RNA polymerase sigma-70 factor (ECF subfamily)
VNQNEEDLALSQRGAAGDHAAYMMLVSKYECQLRGFLGRFVSAEAADDIAQEAFMRAWRSAAQYNGRARYSTWLIAIAWRCHLDCLRKQRAMSAAERSLALPTDSVSTEGTSEVADILARLSRTERAALVLCEGHGWTHGEVAHLLEMPLGTVKSTVARAKEKCRKLWKGEAQ